jgi:hypothetical protein
MEREKGGGGGQNKNVEWKKFDFLGPTNFKLGQIKVNSLNVCNFLSL